MQFSETKDIRYEIKISYSNNDITECYGKFQTPEEAYFEMCKLAAKEAYTQNEEFLDTHTCNISFDAYNKRIELHYDSDDSYCYYQVAEIFNVEKRKNKKHI